ncbi:DUF6607 family protein [Sediminibacterium roseum]|uniref:DUF6607 family protein n=1 Tax=Sediminibacterium roseum TaxID=1978412 RepID=UPI00192A33A2|nr:DUF6607 family protein [Sediminibacterium roseum]
MKKILFLFVATLLITTSFAQSKKEKDAIKSLCGCFDVDFMYAETFSPNSAYSFKKPYDAHGLEWVFPIEWSDKKIVLQHLLVINDSVIVKHWREDWEYEKKDWLVFNHDASWKHVTSNEAVKGEWTQTVWETDDGPRYQGSSKWISNDNKFYWQNTADAPLPRREYSSRSDYNVLQRGNRIIITDTGWVHEQDNNKILRADGKADQLLVQEKGFNIYHKSNESNCDPAKKWWAKNEAFWKEVRSAWDEILNGKNTVHLLAKVQERSMGQEFDKLQKENLSASQLKERITQVLQKFVQPDTRTVSAKN